MNIKKILKFLFPEYQIIDTFRKYGFMTKTSPQNNSTSQQTIRHSNGNSTATHNLNRFSYEGVAKVSSTDLNKKFIKVREELASQIIGQQECLADLLLAFKRPFVTGHESIKPRNTLFLLGSKSSGRHTMVRSIVKQLVKHELLKNTVTTNIDLAQYKGVNDELVFIQDLINVFYSSSDVVILENFEKCPASYLEIINKLVTEGQYRVLEPNGRSSNLQANGKYCVFISEVKESKIIDIFGNQLIKSVGDIITIDDYNQDEIIRLTQLFLYQLNKRCKENLYFVLKYHDDVVHHCAVQYHKKTGINAIQSFLCDAVYKALAEYRLRGNLTKSQNITLELLNNALVMYVDSSAVPIALDSLLPNKYNSNLEDIKKELDLIVGLTDVKEYILNLENNYNVQKQREDAGYKSVSIAMHMVFTGNPGTGKTMMARIVAKYLKAIGVLAGGQLREVTRSDLVGQYVGHTAKLTNEVIQSALGGVLFIDEAYSLCRDKHDVFGIEAVDTLVKAIEDYRDNLVVILAGYTDEIAVFLQANTGLKSRFPNMINFEDYTPQEMIEISHITAKSKGYYIADDCTEPLISLFEKNQIKGRNDSGNGRLVRNIIEKAILEQSKRLAKEPAADMGLLTIEDFKFTHQKKFDLETSLAPIIGLESVKNIIRTQYNLLVANEKRRQAGINVDTKQSLNMIFTGNPGTGKTTVARVMAEMFKEMGLLKQGQLIETDRSGLVAEYVGQTATKTQQLFRSALGGVLFIDEAYALAGGSSFEKEAVDTLVKLIEDYRGEIVVVLAGYKKEMADFMKSNSGLESRFPLMIDFPDYLSDELYKIALLMITNKGFVLTEQAKPLLKEQISAAKKIASPHAGNGRMARNMIEKILRNQSARIAITETTKEELTTILPVDIEVKTEVNDRYDLETELAKVIGLLEVKTYIRSLYARLKVQAERKKIGLPNNKSQTLHMIFKGNPGTGKTMMARIVAEVLYNIGIINTNKLIETDRAGLVAGYVGQTALKTTEKVMEAMDGVLFIDEAYSLSAGANDFGREAIDTLVKLMDDNRERIVVILAGYSQNMDDFLQVNPGLKSRFPNIIEFVDYDGTELMQIAEQFYHNYGYVLTSSAKQKMTALFSQAMQEPSFGNGRYVRNLFEKSLNQQALRLSADTDLTREELITIEAEDIVRV